MATGTAAYAEATVISAGNTGVLNGTQVFAPIQAPINLCGVAASVGGDAVASCTGGSAAKLDGVYDARLISTNNHGILNGTQVFAPIQAPINVCGVAAGVLGNASAWCEGGASADLDGDHHKKKHQCDSRCDHDGDDHDGYGRESTESGDLLGGLPLVGGLTNGLPLVGNLGGSGLPLVGNLTKGGLPLVGSLGDGGLPVVGSLTKGGLPVVGGLLGDQGVARNADAIDIDALDAVGTMGRFDTESDAAENNRSTGGNGGGNGTACNSSCGGHGGGHNHHPKPKPRPRPQPCPDHGHDHNHHQGRHHQHDGDVKLISAGNHGILNGTQVYAPIQIPINVSGIAVGVLGDAAAWSVGGASANQ
ncbi:chaplin family protein [Catellatospora sichuanensis]|uniref:chaplin family protein n=1 Tax=Catellatospora sichuanensis TaxID=1969805 RepID=UPI001642C84F|nr:chaplin family protein [Catellatospora sichuanensis]